MNIIRINKEYKITYLSEMFWEELIAYFPFTVMRNEDNRTIQFGRLQCWYYWWERFMRYTIEMASSGTIIHTKFYEDWYRRWSNINVMSQKSESLQFWYYCSQRLLCWCVWRSVTCSVVASLCLALDRGENSAFGNSFIVALPRRLVCFAIAYQRACLQSRFIATAISAGCTILAFSIHATICTCLWDVKRTTICL
jgi:hypothetical protein